MIWVSNFQKCWVYESKIMFDVLFLEHSQYWLVSTATQLIQIELSPKCVTGMKYLLKNRIQRKISRKIVCVHIESIVVLYPFSIKLAFNAHAIFIFIWNVGEININTISTHTIRRQISRWIRILSWIVHSAHAFGRKFDLKILIGVIKCVYITGSLSTN